MSDSRDGIETTSQLYERNTGNGDFLLAHRKAESFRFDFNGVSALANCAREASI